MKSMIDPGVLKLETGYLGVCGTEGPIIQMDCTIWR